MDSEEASLQKRLAILRRSRTGKKGSITKRIKKLEKVVSEAGSKRVIRALSSGLEAVFAELLQVCDEITRLSSEVDPLNCIEEIRTDVEICIVEARDHLEARQDEPNSSQSYTSSWVNKHAEVVSAGTRSEAASAETRSGADREANAVSQQEFYTPEGGWGKYCW